MTIRDPFKMHFLLHSVAGLMCHLWKALRGFDWLSGIFALSLVLVQPRTDTGFDILVQLCPGAGSWASSRRYSVFLLLSVGATAHQTEGRMLPDES